jgi:5'-3' exonuclease
MTARPKLLLLDGTSVVRRVYEAVPGDKTPGRLDGVLQATMHSIMRSLKEHQPTHFLGAFDAGGPTWRHGLMPTFKLNAPKMDPDLREAMPTLFDRMSEHGFAWVCAPGVEADDVIGTIGVKAYQRGFDVIVASNDIDMCALLEHGLSVYGHFSKEWRGVDWLSRVHGISPQQVPDYLALIGDDRKNIPGVRGIGSTRAKGLLNQYGDLESIIQNASELPGKHCYLIERLGDELRLSRDVLRLKLDVPVSIKPAELALPNRPREARPARVPTEA